MKLIFFDLCLNMREKERNSLGDEFFWEFSSLNEEKLYIMMMSSKKMKPHEGIKY
jgi:hypothetical protein